MVLPLELVVASVTMGYWETLQHISVGVWIAVFLGLIIAINIFGALGYAETEFWFSVLKLAAVVSFMIIGVICRMYHCSPDGISADQYQFSVLDLLVVSTKMGTRL